MMAGDEIGKKGVEAFKQSGKVRNGQEEIQLILSPHTLFIPPFQL